MMIETRMSKLLKTALQCTQCIAVMKRITQPEGKKGRKEHQGRCQSTCEVACKVALYLASELRVPYLHTWKKKCSSEYSSTFSPLHFLEICPYKHQVSHQVSLSSIHAHSAFLDNQSNHCNRAELFMRKNSIVLYTES